MCCYGNTGVVDAGQICVIFMQRTVTKQKLSQQEINLNTNLIVYIEKTKVARHCNIIGCCDVFSMTSACALHVSFVNDKIVKL